VAYVQQSNWPICAVGGVVARDKLFGRTNRALVCATGYPGLLDIYDVGRERAAEKPPPGAD
jgi:hypothetical protein